MPRTRFSMISKAGLIAIGAWFATISGVVLGACGREAPVVIGFAASLSGKDYLLGVEGRNAAELFVKEANARGGVGGRLLRLDIRDLASDDANAAPVTAALVESGVSVIVGYFTSSSAVAALAAPGLGGAALVSPSATADSLDGKADALYRTIMSSRLDSLFLAAHMRARGLRRVLFMATEGNRPYAETYAVPLAREAEVVADIRFGAISDIDYGAIASLRYDAVLIVASPLDTGTVAQELSIRGLSAPLYISGWAGNDSLIAHGGKAVDGAVFVHQTDTDQAGVAAVSSRYRAVYGESPGFAAIQAWDAMLLVEAAIEASGQGGVAAAIRGTRSFEGLSGTIEIDEFGDATRTVYYKKVDGDRIVVVGKAE
ncbi:MAG: ABC transporter substrate-binding protein [Spirochaetes bacterium]|nr:ABC transporter substrate-binding protein [Spirochaetota bacterium]